METIIGSSNLFELAVIIAVVLVAFYAIGLTISSAWFHAKRNFLNKFKSEVTDDEETF